MSEFTTKSEECQLPPNSFSDEGSSKFDKSKPKMTRKEKANKKLLAELVDDSSPKNDMPIASQSVPCVEETPQPLSDNQGEKADESNDHCTKIPLIGPVVVPFDKIKEEKISWLIPGIFPMGMVSTLAGIAGRGKSYFTCWLSSAVTKDTTVYFRNSPIPKGSVILCNAEDSADKTIKKRLRENGANMAKVKTIPHVRVIHSEGKNEIIEVPLTLERIDDFRRVFKENPDCRLLIIDPVSSFWGKTNALNNTKVRVILSEIQRLAEEFNVAIILVTHLTKTKNTNAINRVTGSVGLMGAVRAGWLLTCDDETGLRTVGCIKLNVSEIKSGFTFRITDGRVEIDDDEVDINADEMLQAEMDSQKEARGRKRNEIVTAMEWLHNYLADGLKPAGSKQNPTPDSVYYKSQQAGHSWGTVRRAAQELGVIKKRVSDASFWGLPDQDQQLDHNSTPTNCEQVVTSESDTTCAKTMDSNNEQVAPSESDTTCAKITDSNNEQVVASESDTACAKTTDSNNEQVVEGVADTVPFDSEMLDHCLDVKRNDERVKSA